jgi:lysophospholipase L1-like esterase
MRVTAAKLALAPVLIAQGMALRRHALRLPEAAGPRRGEAGDGPPLRLLIVGDSSAAGVGARDQRAALAGRLAAELGTTHRVTWRLTARTGATTADTLARLSTTQPEPFDIAVTALGVNDVTRSVPLARWCAHQVALRILLTERFGVSHVIASGLPPMGDFPALPQPLRWVAGASARHLDRGLARAAAHDPRWSHARFAVTLTPDLMAEDGFHPGPAGYALWARMLAPSIRAALPTATATR